MATKKAFKILAQELPWTTCASDLKQYFSQFGPVVSAKVIFDEKTGFSKRHGFIVFALKESFDAALLRRKHEIESKIIIVKTVNE